MSDTKPTIEKLEIFQREYDLGSYKVRVDSISITFLFEKQHFYIPKLKNTIHKMRELEELTIKYVDDKSGTQIAWIHFYPWNSVMIFSMIAAWFGIFTVDMNLKTNEQDEQQKKPDTLPDKH